MQWDGTQFCFVAKMFTGQYCQDIVAGHMAAIRIAIIASTLVVYVRAAAIDNSTKSRGALTSIDILSWYSDEISLYAVVGKSGIRSWYDAEQTCRNLLSSSFNISIPMATSSGHLVAISTDGQMTTLSSMLKNLSPVSGGYWTGGRCQLTSWRWTDGSSLGSYTPWNVPQSSTATYEQNGGAGISSTASEGDCVSLSTTSPSWIKRDCTDRMPFACRLKDPRSTNCSASQYCDVIALEDSGLCFLACWSQYGSLTSGVTWYEARDFCEQVGAELVSTSVEDVQDLLVMGLRGLSQPIQECWIGLHRNQWTWVVNGDEVPTAYWSGLTASTGSFSNCLTIQLTSQTSTTAPLGHWQAQDCSSLLPFVCQFPLIAKDAQTTSLSILVPPVASGISSSLPSGVKATTTFSMSSLSTVQTNAPTNVGLTAGLTVMAVILIVLIAGVTSFILCCYRRHKAMIAESRLRHVDQLRASHYNTWRTPSSTVPNENRRPEDMFTTSRVIPPITDVVERRVAWNERRVGADKEAANCGKYDILPPPEPFNHNHQTTVKDKELMLAGGVSASNQPINSGQNLQSEQQAELPTTTTTGLSRHLSETARFNDGVSPNENSLTTSTADGTSPGEMTSSRFNLENNSGNTVGSRQQPEIPLPPAVNDVPKVSMFTRLTGRPSNIVDNPVVRGAMRQRSASFGGTPAADTARTKSSRSQLTRHDSLSADRRRRHQRRLSLVEIAAAAEEEAAAVTQPEPGRRASISSTARQPLPDTASPSALQDEIFPSTVNASRSLGDISRTSPSIDSRSRYRVDELNGQAVVDADTVRTMSKPSVVTVSALLEPVSSKPPVLIINSAAKANNKPVNSRHHSNDQDNAPSRETGWETSDRRPDVRKRDVGDEMVDRNEVPHEGKSEQHRHHHDRQLSRDGSNDRVAHPEHHQHHRHRQRSRHRDGSADAVSMRARERNGSFGRNRTDSGSTIHDGDRHRHRRRRGNDNLGDDHDFTHRRDEANTGSGRHRRHRSWSSTSRRRDEGSNYPHADGVIATNGNLHLDARSITKDKLTSLEALVASYNANSLVEP